MSVCVGERGREGDRGRQRETEGDRGRQRRREGERGRDAITVVKSQTDYINQIITIAETTTYIYNWPHLMRSLRLS